MLTHLSIHNYALIDALSVSFQEGFSVITGETGAGKSIVLGGLGLILGNRADSSAITNTAQKCIVEASFLIEAYNLKKWFKANELDYETETIIRREILPSGKSRAFVNDTPVSLQVIKQLAQQLLDVHSQHQTMQLLSTEYQFEVVDALAKNSTVLRLYKQQLQTYQLAVQELEKLKAKKESASQTSDYNAFLLEELVAAKLSTHNIEALEQEQMQLSNVAFIQEQLLKANQILSNDELGVLNLIIELKNTLKDVTDFSVNLSQLHQRIESTYIELDDVFSELETEQGNIEANPNRLIEVQTALDTINGLLVKHQAANIEELIAIEERLAINVEGVEGLDEKIQQKEQEIKTLQQQLLDNGKKLTQSRSAVLPNLKKQLEKIVKNLGMEHAQFSIELSSEEAFLSNGLDELSMLFTANKGGRFNELKKSASGGELSRIMLAIKAVLSKHKKLPTIMFDEIDTGVSGEVADKMGLLMEYMSENMQVFSITHLPQIASKGGHHYKVYKETTNGVTQSNLKALTKEDRVQEIAEMLGGKDLSETAIKHAKELLKM